MKVAYSIKRKLSPSSEPEAGTSLGLSPDLPAFYILLMLIFQITIIRILIRIWWYISWSDDNDEANDHAYQDLKTSSCQLWEDKNNFGDLHLVNNLSFSRKFHVGNIGWSNNLGTISSLRSNKSNKETYYRQYIMFIPGWQGHTLPLMYLFSPPLICFSYSYASS